MLTDRLSLSGWMIALLAASNIDPRELTDVLLAPFTVIGSVTAFTAGAMAA